MDNVVTTVALHFWLDIFLNLYSYKDNHKRLDEFEFQANQPQTVE